MLLWVGEYLLSTYLLQQVFTCAGIYKDTVNLPETIFPMRANAVKREPDIQRRWESKDLYSSLLHHNKGPPFTLHDGYAFSDSNNGLTFEGQHQDILAKTCVRPSIGRWMSACKCAAPATKQTGTLRIIPHLDCSSHPGSCPRETYEPPADVLFTSEASPLRSKFPACHTLLQNVTCLECMSSTDGQSPSHLKSISLAAYKVLKMPTIAAHLIQASA